MEAVIFHKTLELNIPDELGSKCLAACEIMEKEESLMKPQFDINDMKSEARFPLIALSAVAGQMESSNTVKEQELNDEMHALSIKLPSFSDISEIIAYKMKATPYYEQFLRAASEKITSGCKVLKEIYQGEDEDIYRVAVLNVLMDQQ